MLHQPSALPEIDPPEGGTITAIKPQVNSSDRFSIFLDDDFALGLHADVVAEAGLKKGMTLEPAEWAALIRKDLYHRAWSRCLNYLASRPRTKQEIRRRLTAINTPEDAVEQIMDRLEDLGYVDDRDYAERYVASRVRSKGYGPRRLKQELRKRGIDRRTADEAVGRLSSKVVREKLDELAENAISRYSRVDDEWERRRKITAWLARRGYDYGEINRALDRLRSDI